MLLVVVLLHPQSTVSSLPLHLGTHPLSWSITFHVERCQTGNCSLVRLPASGSIVNSHTSKPPTQSKKFKTLQKLILSYFSNVTHILSNLTDDDMLQLAVSESAKLLPYVVTSRRAIKLYLKVGFDGVDDFVNHNQGSRNAWHYGRAPRIVSASRRFWRSENLPPQVMPQLWITF